MKIEDILRTLLFSEETSVDKNDGAKCEADFI
jgi:hypothetical protein